MQNKKEKNSQFFPQKYHNKIDLKQKIQAYRQYICLKNNLKKYCNIIFTYKTSSYDKTDRFLIIIIINVNIQISNKKKLTSLKQREYLSKILVRVRFNVNMRECFRIIYNVN